MNKLITIKKADVQPLKILAVLADKDLKNYIQDILSEHVRVNSNVWWVAFFSNCYQRIGIWLVAVNKHKDWVKKIINK